MSMSHLFADISNNNRSYNAVEYAKAGHVFVAIKATEGVSYVDANHRAWVLHSHLHHIGVAHYHFARPDLNNSATAEAAHFLGVVNPLAGPRDYLVLDLERATPNGWAHDPEWSSEFDAYVQHASRFHTVLYASRSVLDTSDAFLFGDNRRVWDADWSGDPNYAPKGYTVLFRQYTDGVSGPGPREFAGIGRCDGNRMTPQAFDEITRHRPC